MGNVGPSILWAWPTRGAKSLNISACATSILTISLNLCLLNSPTIWKCNTKLLECTWMSSKVRVTALRVDWEKQQQKILRLKSITPSYSKCCSAVLTVPSYMSSYGCSFAKLLFVSLHWPTLADYFLDFFPSPSIILPLSLSPQVVQMAWQEQTPCRAWWDWRQTVHPGPGVGLAKHTTYGRDTLVSVVWIATMLLPTTS